MGPVFVLLPERWRENLPYADSIHWRESAQISGLVQAIVMLAAYITWFLYSLGHWAKDAILAAMKANSQQGIGVGMFVTMGFILVALHPLTWVFWYFSYEGLMRVLKVRAMEKTPGTLPLRLAEHVMHLARYGTWSTKAPLVKDEVTRAGENAELKIASCRPKDHWKFPLAIRYQDQFFQVLGEEHAVMARERPHVYLLRRLPTNEIIRGLEDYDPEDVLHEEAPPGFFVTVAGELRKKLGEAAARIRT